MGLSKKVVNVVTNYQDPRSLGARLRAKRLAPLLAMIREVFASRGAVTIIDIGGTESYWSILPSGYLDEFNVHVTVVNLPREQMPSDHGRFTFIAGDACDLASVPDHAFDIAHSNSVVEHVGDWSRMVRFASEVRRVGRSYFVQTPNYWFPVEPHCMTLGFHWLPKPLRVWLVRRFQLGNWGRATSIDQAVRIVEGARLLSHPMFEARFPDGEVVSERFCFLPKSHIAIRR